MFLTKVSVPILFGSILARKPGKMGKGVGPPVPVVTFLSQLC